MLLSIIYLINKVCFLIKTSVMNFVKRVLVVALAVALLSCGQEQQEKKNNSQSKKRDTIVTGPTGTVGTGQGSSGATNGTGVDTGIRTTSNKNINDSL
jgi:hypothetical protein